MEAVPPNSRSTATNLPSRKLSLDELDMQDTAGEVGKMYYCGPLHMDEQKKDDQIEPTYSSSVPIGGVILKTCRKQWTIGRGGERGSEIPMLMVRHDDTYIYIYIYN